MEKFPKERKVVGREVSSMLDSISDDIKLLPLGQGFERVTRFEALKRLGRILPEEYAELQKMLPPGQGFELVDKFEALKRLGKLLPAPELRKMLPPGQGFIMVPKLEALRKIRKALPAPKERLALPAPERGFTLVEPKPKTILRKDTGLPKGLIGATGYPSGHPTRLIKP
jgi:hypothetical protein